MKFKIGNRVKVIKKGSHAQEIGAICKIVNIDTSPTSMPYLAKCPDGNEMWFSEEQIILVEKQFTKSDLQNGDIVTYRDGQARTVVCNKLVNEDGAITNYLNKYEDDLTYKDRQKDIVKVERPVKYETVFERKEEILDETEKRYLANVIRPFKDKVSGIRKCSCNNTTSYIRLVIDDDTEMNFPDFETGTMYQGMKAGKEYTLEELGL